MAKVESITIEVGGAPYTWKIEDVRELYYVLKELFDNVPVALPVPQTEGILDHNPFDRPRSIFGS